MTQLSRIAALLITVFVASSAFAEFTLFDNFNSYPNGPLAGQGPAGNIWAVGQPTFTDVISVTDGAAAFGVSSASGVVNAYRSLTPAGLSIPNASTAATFFFQFRLTSTTGNNWNFALNDVAAPTGNSSDNEVQFNFDTSAASFRARNAGAFKVLSTTGDAAGNVPLLANSTYNVWFVVNNSVDQYTVYMENDEILTLNGTPHQVLANDGTGGLFTFRNSASGTVANDLTTVNMGPGGTSNNNIAFVDNLYADLSGQNLLNPVPEPSTLSLSLCGLLAFVACRRNRRN